MSAAPAQLTLRPTSRDSAMSCIKRLLASGRWMTPYELQRAIFESTGRLHSESAITARLRDLRKPKYGGHTIECRQRAGHTSREYRWAA